MADGNIEAKRLRGATIMSLLVGVVQLAVLAVLLSNPPAGGGWTLRVGLAGLAAAVAFGVAANFARRRQRLSKAGPDGDRA